MWEIRQLFNLGALALALWIAGPNLPALLHPLGAGPATGNVRPPGTRPGAAYTAPRVRPGPVLLPPRHPAANLAVPRPTCSTRGSHAVSGPCRIVGSYVIWEDTPAVRAAAVRAIDAGGAQETLPPLHLPADFRKLSPAHRILWLINWERTSRGLPPVRPDPALMAAARRGAAARTDPGPPAGWNGAKIGAIWGAGIDVLTISFAWMYDDGWGGSRATTANLACTSPTSPVCWGHRFAILGNYGPSPLAGAAVVPQPDGLISAAAEIEG